MNLIRNGWFWGLSAGLTASVLCFSLIPRSPVVMALYTLGCQAYAGYACYRCVLEM